MVGATPCDARAFRFSSSTATGVVLAIGKAFTSKSDEFYNESLPWRLGLQDPPSHRASDYLPPLQGPLPRP